MGLWEDLVAPDHLPPDRSRVTDVSRAGDEVSADDLGRAAARGGMWGVAGEVSSRAAASIVFFVLAGFLTPAQFGAAAVAFVCAQVANALTYAGLGAAVQLLGPDDRRDRTAVGLALAAGLFGAGVLALLAGPLCDLLGAPGATNLVRLVGLALPMLQTSEVLAALLARDLEFRAAGIAIVTASVLSAAAGLGLAAAGAGAASLVAQAMILPGVRLLMLIGARPATFRPVLHPEQIAELWHVGRDLLLSTVFETAASNIDNIVVSALAGPAALGAYGFAFNLTTLPMFVVGLAASRVAIPVYAKLRTRPALIAPAFLQTIEITTWLTALPLGFIAIAGPEALQTIFGHKWDAVSEALRVLALHGWLRGTETASTAVLVALGHAATTRRVQQFQFVLATALLFPLVDWKGPLGAALAIVIAVTAGTSYSLASSTGRTDAARLTLLRRMLEAAFGGFAGGMGGLFVLVEVGGLPGLLLGLLAAVSTWTIAFGVFRPATVSRGVRLLLPAR
jgi:O-antigen/teichoic acid export membrane protein